ncbi:MAG: DUF2232 domain-containing protein [Gammaproteobacteria bacterium]|nr:DUF2232 domain-containing protein [Gammaproteobacteria bacterium]
MRLLASFVMQGRSQAVMAIGVLSLLSLLFPPLSIISSAVVALVTLRRGPQDGLFVTLLGTAACALLAMLVQVDAISVVGFTLLLWLPVWILALLLRSSSSLALTTTIALVFGLLVIVVYYVEFSDPVVEWRKLLEPLLQSFNQTQTLETDQQIRLLDVLSHWMTGLMAAGFFLQLVISVLLARWWQSLLYNPGGYRSEFHQLRLPRALAMFTVAVVGLLLLDMDVGSPMLDYLAMLLITAYLLQGLALAHGIRAQLGVSQGWLFAMYVLLFIAVPHMVITLATAGIADAWLDLRSRIGKGKSSGGAS